ncbi:GIY-YIG nuclease family protein [Patescibacteria group bacterium]|nr:GIY-YIG nuclease family protein [Patescibacteria group bacterium]
MYYAYILLCCDNKTYVGGSDNLKERVERHKMGYVPATKNRLPVRLIAYFAFVDEHVAFAFEKYLKSGSGRAFMKKHIFSGKKNL